ncbi:MAG: Na+/H+ antiporter subunit E [Phycisphaeraceae bacterium]|nr:Na+/H+ antiporter subunit E [Phycisphaeraceae bacterium]MBX3368163.1 Na+/H+ antiporter subunit E [Phycisphaeraceae bacterium]QYK47836.1 MAG: Na+/H+ antiporter subunit E [Phycisphaeraceae bacterium]
MSLLAANLILAVLWGLTTENFSVMNLTIGYLVSLGILVFVRRALGDSHYFRDISEVLALVWFFLKELVIANIRMAKYTLSPLDRLRPGIIAVPMDFMTDAEITLLANLITLTPGTLSIDVSKDKRTLFVHVMDITSAQAVRDEIKQGFEARVLRAAR